MGIHILESPDGNKALYCSTTMWAFGGIFYENEDPQNFLDWAGDGVRSLTDPEFSSKQSEWRVIWNEIIAAENYIATEGFRAIKDTAFLSQLEDIELANVDIEDHPHYTYSSIERCTYKGVQLADLYIMYSLNKNKSFIIEQACLQASGA